MLVLDLAQVDRIDAGSLGVLLGLREWARSNAIRLRLMNVTNQVEHVLELTRLDRVQFCSVWDMFPSAEACNRYGTTVGRSSEPANAKGQLQLFGRRVRCSLAVQ
jgi:hypothetical protein